MGWSDKSVKRFYKAQLRCLEPNNYKNFFDLSKPEVIKESMKVVPKYGGKLKLLKTSVSLPQSIIDDLRRLARIRGMTSYQSLLRELVSEKVYEEKLRLKLFT